MYPQPGRALNMLATIVFAHDLRSIMLPRRPTRNLDSLGIRLQLTQPFHQRTSHNGSPAVWGLHDFNIRIDGGSNGLAEIGVLAKTSDQEDRFYLFVGGCDLAADEGDDFVDDRVEHVFHVGACHLEFSASDALRWVVGQSRDFDILAHELRLL